MSIQQEQLLADLLESYSEFDRERRLLYSKVACVLTIILVPAGLSLDYIVYPSLFGRLLTIRLCYDIFGFALLALHYTSYGKEHIRALTIVLATAVLLTMSLMVYLSEGAASPYYAGLNLIFFGAVVLLPITCHEVTVVFCVMLCSYLIACMAHGGIELHKDILFSNLYFVTLTGILGIVASYYLSNARFKDFGLRHEIAKRNKDLAESYEKLAELDHLKSEFFANISHELRTPLTLILTPVEELISRGANVTVHVRKTLDIVWENALRLLRLINDLLELVRLEEGRNELRLEPVDFSVFVPGMVDSVRHLAKRKGLTMSAEGTPEPLVVMGDPLRLEKVLLNLLMNAIKFTPGPGKVIARWRSEGDQAVVEVEDTGIGIPDEDLPHIFDRFHQVDGSTTRRYQGAGIGLALARELAVQHGGTLEARSELGKSTTLTMTLPLAGTAMPLPARITDSAQTAEPAAIPSDEPILSLFRAADRSGSTSDFGEQDLSPLGSGETSILVVDDEPNLRHFLASALASEYRVLQAADGEAALQVVRQSKPDLVILDLMLPGMDGLAVCEAIKRDEQTKSTRVVLLTARTDEAAKIAALDRGADDFLIKPFSTVEVRKRLANLLRAAKLEEDLKHRNTELELTVAQLQQAEAQLVQSEKMNALGNLAAGLLHEINNPLNFTMAALQLAEQDVQEDDSELREMLRDIGHGMERIRDIVSDLRAFAYPSAASASERVSVRSCLDSALKLTSRAVDGITVHQEISGDILAVGSKTQITHVFLNLLTNAAQSLRSAQNGSPEIRVSATPAGERVTIGVWDNGGGIDPAHLPRIFNPFFTTKEVGEGIGLGLSICHTIVKNHGGEIQARSEPGRWTEVSFDLPLAPGET